MHKFLGVELLEMKDGYVKLIVPFREEVIGNFLSRFWNGGMVSAIMDSCGGMAVGMSYYPGMNNVSTIDMRVDYLKPALASAIIGEGKVIRKGNKSALAEMNIYQENTGIRIATGRAVFNIRNENNHEIE